MEISKKSILEVKNLRKKYDDYTAIKELNISVNQGEIYGFLGPNGAGKTTTIECILGLKDIEKGSISLLGQSPIANRKRLFQQVGVQFQSTEYHNRIKVKEMCRLTAALYNKPINYLPLIEQFGLKDKLDHVVNQMSGGEKQKLSIILALLNNPKIVFLDELTTGLDPLARRGMWAYLEKMKENGLTIFLTSHYMDEVTRLCDRITIINKGIEIITGETREVIKNSGHSNMEDAYLYFINEEVCQ